jgi:hypothetical protein
LWHTRNLLDALNPTAARLAAEATPAFAQALELAKTNPDALDEVEPPHVAAVAALDRTIAALDAPIGLATRMAAEAPGAGRGRNRMAVEVAWMAWRCFEDVTGEEPRPGGGEPTTRYRQFLSRLFEALCIKADTRRPAQAAARRAHAKKTAFAGR